MSNFILRYPIASILRAPSSPPPDIQDDGVLERHLGCLIKYTTRQPGIYLFTIYFHQFSCSLLLNIYVAMCMVETPASFIDGLPSKPKLVTRDV